MSETKKRYGYTGKGLRVNLTTGKFTVEPTFPRFNGLIGGTAFGYHFVFRGIAVRVRRNFVPEHAVAEGGAAD